MTRTGEITACVFDAYGTLLDLQSPLQAWQAELGDRGAALSEIWRLKQLEYAWLRSLMGRHADFWQVTVDALDFALDAPSIRDAALRQGLLDSYRRIRAYPEVPATLRQLGDAGLRLAILSNGSPDMLRQATERANLSIPFEDVLSIEAAGMYKPSPAAYRLAVDRLDRPAQAICFVSANGWDVAGAACFGFRTVWLNRSGRPRERLPAAPAATIPDLGSLPAVLGL